MNMAACVALLENEHSAMKVYLEILNRWPFSMEAVYELVKLGVTLEQVLASVEMSAALESYKEGRTEASVEKVALGWIASLYQDWNSSLDSYHGGMSIWRDVEMKRLESLASQQQQLLQLETQYALPLPSTSTSTTSSDRPSSAPTLSTSGAPTSATSASSSNAGAPNSPKPLPSNLQLVTPLRGSDAMHIIVCAQVELFKGDLTKVVALLDRVKPECRLLGVEYLAWARLRLGSADELCELQLLLGRQYPSSWEAWYVASIREWLADPARRSVHNALDMISRAQLVAPTNTLILVTRAYMYVYKIKDSLLHLSSGIESEATHKRQMSESTKMAADCIRDAWSISKDPFVTHSLLHIYGLLSPLLHESKIIEIIAEVDALNPLMKRFKTSPQLALSQASTNPSLATIYARLLARKADLCCTKVALAQMAIDNAAHTKSFEPNNILAQTVTIRATALKTSAPIDQTVDLMAELLKKAETIEEMNTVRVNMLSLLSNSGLLERSKEISDAFYASNKLSEDAIFWCEDTRMKIEKTSEEEDDEVDDDDEEGDA